MNRGRMITRVYKVLTRTGFYTSDPNDIRSLSFDIICRRDGNLFILKVLTNVDSFTRRNATQLKLLASMLGGCPLMIGLKTSGRDLKDGIVYLRYLISIMTLETLYDALVEGVYPSVYAAPGGFYVDLDNDKLKRLRGKRKMSLGALAKAVGVSRKAIQMYEDGMNARLEIGLSLEEELGAPLIKCLDPFVLNEELIEKRKALSEVDNTYSSVHRKLKMLGYEVIPLFRCPFDAFTRDDNILLLTGFQRTNQILVERAKMMSRVASITEKQSVFFANDNTLKKNIGGNPVIRKEEVERISTSEEILELVNERRSEAATR